MKSIPVQISPDEIFLCVKLDSIVVSLFQDILVEFDKYIQTQIQITIWRWSEVADVWIFVIVLLESAVVLDGE